MNTIYKSRAKVHLPIRVHRVVSRICAIEVKTRKLGSLADFVELAVFAAAEAPASKRLILNEIKQDQATLSRLLALGIRLPSPKEAQFQVPGKNNC